MTKPADQTLAVLKQIRDAVTQTNERIDQTNVRLAENNQRLDRVERRQTESEIRLATELAAVIGAIHTVRDAVLADKDLRRTVEEHEQRLTAIERRTG